MPHSLTLRVEEQFPVPLPLPVRRVLDCFEAAAATRSVEARFTEHQNRIIVGEVHIAEGVSVEFAIVSQKLLPNALQQHYETIHARQATVDRQHLL